MPLQDWNEISLLLNLGEKNAKSAPSRQGTKPPPNNGALGIHKSTSETAQGRAQQTDGNNRPHLMLHIAMRPKCFC